jgi:hypothetical protein
MNYVPIIHDFALLQDGKIILLDAPFMWDFSNIISEPQVLKFLDTGKIPQEVPIRFDTSKSTHIILYDPSTKSRRIYYSNTPFFLFHFAYTQKEGENIAIYAPMYDNLDFSSLGISGKYRKIVLQNNIAKITKNPALERLNLDFPVRWGKYIVLRCIENKVICGFVVCKGLDIRRRIRLPTNRFFCGEPVIIKLFDTPFIMGFSYDENKNGYLSLIGLWENMYVEEPLNSTITIGFHSLFLNKNIIRI